MAEPLTHHESHVLAVIRKWEPVTAYFVRKALRQSLASSFSDSPGSVYPIIERLKRRGYVTAQAALDSGRKAELLACTPHGECAIVDWLVRVDQSDLLPEDPWRTRVLFSDLLDHPAQVEWLQKLRSAAEAELDAINGRLQMATVPKEADAAEGARLQTEARLIWLDRLMARSISREG